MRKSFTRRNFLITSTTGLVGMTVSPAMGFTEESNISTENAVSPFVSEVERLAVEEPYDYHKHLSTAPVHVWRRDKSTAAEKDEMTILDHGWKLVYLKQAGIVTLTAVQDFQDYLVISHGVAIEFEERATLNDWKKLSQCIVAGTREQLPGCGLTLKNPKDYEIQVTPRRI
ncbi:MAG: hypothetical protein PHW81_05830, partial [Petrimonas sp.]|nr:hypothetical protein [Petrimonas sp.]